MTAISEYSPRPSGWVGRGVNVDEECREWYSSLPDDLRAEVRGTVGMLPVWMVESLQRAQLPVVSVEFVDGDAPHGCLMPTALMLLIADLPGS